MARRNPINPLSLVFVVAVLALSIYSDLQRTRLDEHPDGNRVANLSRRVESSQTASPPAQPVARRRRLDNQVPDMLVFGAHVRRVLADGQIELFIEPATAQALVRAFGDSLRTLRDPSHREQPGRREQDPAWQEQDASQGEAETQPSSGRVLPTVCIRLSGLRLPVRRREIARETREFLEYLLVGRDVYMLLDPADRGDEAAQADLYVGDRWVNGALVAAGFAACDAHHGRSSELAQLQAFARAHGRGIWATDASTAAP